MFVFIDYTSIHEGPFKGPCFDYVFSIAQRSTMDRNIENIKQSTNQVDNNSALSTSHSGLSVWFRTPNIVLVVLCFIDCVFEIKFDLI